MYKQNTKEQAFGRWREIYNYLGLNVGDGKHCPCPICSTDPSSDRFRCDGLDKNGEYYCNQ